MDRSFRRVSGVARLALAAQGVYILVISTVPFVRLFRAGVVDRQLLVLQFVLWSVVPAVALLVAAWTTGRRMDPLTERLVRGGAIVSTVYLALGCVIVLARPSTTGFTMVVRLCALVAGAIALIGLPRASSEPETTLALTPPVQSTSRSTTTIR